MNLTIYSVRHTDATVGIDQSHVQFTVDRGSARHTSNVQYVDSEGPAYASRDQVAASLRTYHAHPADYRIEVIALRSTVRSR